MGGHINSHLSLYARVKVIELDDIELTTTTFTMSLVSYALTLY